MGTLFDKLEAHDGPPEDAALASSLWDAFGCERTVVVVDMAGFTRTSLEHGVVYYLTLIRDMRRLTCPLVESEGGRVVKCEADNLFAVFTEPIEAWRFLKRAYAATAEANKGMEASAQIHLSAGVDHGRILLDESDFFGDAVNLASRLGEDLARRGEVLVSEEAWVRLPGERGEFTEVVNEGLHGPTRKIYRWER